MKLSLFSVSYAGYWGQDQLNVTEFIAKAAKLGYEAVMLAGKRPHLSPLDANEEYVAAIRSALSENTISCEVIAGYTDFSPLAASEVPYLEMQISYVAALAKLAHLLGTRHIRVFTAYESTLQSPLQVWQSVVHAIREMCDRAAEYQVTVVVQNHHDVGVHSDALLEVLNDIARPNCKLGFDAWSPALRGEDLYECAKKMAPHTAITTSADYVRLPRYNYRPEFINYERAYPDLVRAVKFGTGFIDYSAFFRGLQEGGFTGIANYEMCSPVRGGGAIENLDAYAAHYLDWMRSNLK
ncbi:sugar phosphate isomerase/epimerase family protein [Bythopirellula polymerisocia]|uniref:3-dehydroshikimate dehydratase n=1 Tax=Bythopirellula polymerisocia TaxID=2528003 RepID=A0A5C6CHM7_9BACT|nr:sugar phosphate isomerase/epimerase family protein [Bythopirellula polymerisocia]TWU22781.1 3-dehydroshikimate dehydratase [Bythopirellula polymerisocia]